MNGDQVDLLDEVMSRVARTAPPAPPIDELITRARRSRRRHRLRVGGAAMATLAVAVVVWPGRTARHLRAGGRPVAHQDRVRRRRPA